MSVFLKLADRSLCDEHAIREAAYPAALSEILRDEDLEAHGFAAVQEGDIPALEPWQELSSELIDLNGEYKIVYRAIESSAAKDIRAASIAAKRYDVEVSGIKLNGILVPTDRHSQSVLTARYVRALNDSNYGFNFKAPGGFVYVTAEQIILIAEAVEAHVQAAFDQEVALLIRLENGELVSGDDWE